MKTSVPTLLLILVLTLSARSTLSAEPIWTGGSFDEVAVGARAPGMGSAFTAVAEGPEAIWWNPAGLAKATSVGAADRGTGASLGFWSPGESEVSARALLVPVSFDLLGETGAAIAVAQLRGGREITAIEPTPMSEDWYEQIAVSVAYRPYYWLMVGATRKSVTIRHPGQEADGSLWEAGVMFRYKVWPDVCRIDERGCTRQAEIFLGASRSFGARDPRLDSRSVEIPQYTSLGAALTAHLVWGTHLILAGDWIHFDASDRIDYDESNDRRFRLGFDLHLLGFVALRAGLQKNPDWKGSAHAGGFGLQFNLGPLAGVAVDWTAGESADALSVSQSTDFDRFAVVLRYPPFPETLSLFGAPE
jgi:hypothetical protein